MRRTLTGTLLGILLVGILSATAAAQQQNIAIVYRLLRQQQLLVTDLGGTDYQAELGRTLNHGDDLFTGRDTQAAIRFTDDGSIMRMNPSTQMQIRAEGERAALRKTLQIEVGELWARVNRNEGAEYRIETPTAVAAVKGTEFYVRVTEDGTTTIITLEGALDFFNDVGAVEIPAGFTGSSVSTSEAPTVGKTTSEGLASFTSVGASEEGGAVGEEEMVEIEIEFMDENGNRKVMVITVPKSQAQQFIPPVLN